MFSSRDVMFSFQQDNDVLRNNYTHSLACEGHFRYFVFWFKCIIILHSIGLLSRYLIILRSYLKWHMYLALDKTIKRSIQGFFVLSDFFTVGIRDGQLFSYMTGLYFVFLVVFFFIGFIDLVSNFISPFHFFLPFLIFYFLFGLICILRFWIPLFTTASVIFQPKNWE